VKYFPIFIDLRDRPVLLVGGGVAAARKARLLVRAGASLTVIATPPLHDQLSKLASDTSMEVVGRDFSPRDIGGRDLVFSATGVHEIDRYVAHAARAADVPVNVVDRPDLSTFIMPSTIDRDPITIAVSTGGTAPMLARLLRERFEKLLPAGLGGAVMAAERQRAYVKQAVTTEASRRRLWQDFFEQILADASASVDEIHLSERLLATANNVRHSRKPAAGMVYLVGAGPGDPDLLTIRALRLMQQADVIMYDHLVSAEVLERARREAEWIAVGKPKGCHARSQDEINALMMKRAQAGQIVVRLKGGDPLLFGRGGEELTYLRTRGIRVEIVPGITAALACSAYAGIPLTDRHKASRVTFVAGHSKNGDLDLDWTSLVGERHTLVIYMGVATAGPIARQLIEHGLKPATPVAVIENGTRRGQRIITGELVNLESIVRDNAIAAPAVIIIGSVVGDALNVHSPRCREDHSR
jgi:uroporphyrin-III C-methyltransferase/precorrin-2 dehydrogenase/sirohydrochlorin ferrochelatase